MKSKIKPFYLILLSLFHVLLGAKALGAACCGGGFAAPSLIVGDDKAQVSTSYGVSQVADDVGSDSLWRKREAREINETFKVDGAHIFEDRWQAGLSLPVVRRSRAGETSTGLGDVSATVGYEYLPDWDYNPWRPRGVGFIQVTAPTGRSINESDAKYQLDSRGRGFWAIGLGTVLTKIIRRWDVFTAFDVHRSFDKEYRNSESRGTLKPGYGGNLGFGGGYSLALLRFGASLTWTYEDPIDVIGTTNSSGTMQRYATAVLSASYLFVEEWSATLSYSDQTLFGSPTNTSLGRSGLLLIQKRWLR